MRVAALGPGSAARAGMTLLLYPQHAVDLTLVGCAAGEIVKGFFRHADDVVLDEIRALAGAVLRMLQAAFPFEHRPGVVTILDQPGRALPLAGRRAGGLCGDLFQDGGLRLSWLGGA